MKKSFLFFAILMTTYLFLQYVVGMPTARRMDFVVQSLNVGSLLVLAICLASPKCYKLLRLAQYGWLASVVVGILALLTTISVGLWKIEFPFFSQQWYAISILLGIIGAFAVYLLQAARGECEMEDAERADVFSKAAEGAHPSES